jgi:hypothetical protein
LSLVSNDDRGSSDQVRTLLHPCGRCVKRVRTSTDSHKSYSCGKDKSTESSSRSDHLSSENFAPTHGTWQHRSIRILGILAFAFPPMPSEGRIRMLHGDGDSLSSSAQGLRSVRTLAHTQSCASSEVNRRALFYRESLCDDISCIAAVELVKQLPALSCIKRFPWER